MLTLLADVLNNYMDIQSTVFLITIITDIAIASRVAKW